MGPTEILVTGGVAAVLAAAVGGGSKAFGIEVPLLTTLKQQIFAFTVGVGLIIAGLANAGSLRWPRAGTNQVAPSAATVEEQARVLISGSSWRNLDEGCEYARRFSVRDNRINIMYRGEPQGAALTLDTASATSVTAYNNQYRVSFTIDADELVYDNGRQSVRMTRCP